MLERSPIYTALGLQSNAAAPRHDCPLDRDRVASMADEGGVSAAEMDLREQIEDSLAEFPGSAQLGRWIAWGAALAAAVGCGVWLWRRRNA